LVTCQTNITVHFSYPALVRFFKGFLREVYSEKNAEKMHTTVFNID